MSRLKKITDDYEIGKKLGSGISGNVIEIISKDNPSKRYAIKNINPDDEKNRQEIYILKKLLHYNKVIDIKKIETLINESGYPKTFLFTKYSRDYITLDKFIDKENNYLPDSDFNDIFNQLDDVLKYIHKLDIVHHDIKPKNLLINFKNLKIKYIDFGLACDDITHNNPINQGFSGTYKFCDPKYYIKIKNKNKLSLEDLKQSDLFSLGVVLYYCIAGKTQYDILHKNIFNSMSDPTDFYYPLYVKYIKESNKIRNDEFSHREQRNFEEMYFRKYNFDSNEFNFDNKSVLNKLNKINPSINLRNLLSLNKQRQHYV